MKNGVKNIQAAAYDGARTVLRDKNASLRCVHDGL